MREANLLTRIALRNTQAAFLRFNPDEPDRKGNIILVEIVNDGNLIATDVRGKIRMVSKSLPDMKTLKHISALDFGGIGESWPTHTGASVGNVDISGFTADDWQRVKERKEALVMEAVVNYGDGLGEEAPPQPVCFAWWQVSTTARINPQQRWDNCDAVASNMELQQRLQR